MTISRGCLIDHRAASARASAQRAASAPLEVPLAQMEATPSSIRQNHPPSRVAHLPTPASASFLPNTGRRAEPMVQLASHRQIADEEVPPLSQMLGAGMQQGAAHLPDVLAAGLQQPLTQLPSQGYDGAAVSDWPKHTPAPQPPMPPLEGRRPLSAQPHCMPNSRHVSGTALRSTPAGMGPYPSAEVLSEQRQWPLDAAASRRGTGREYLSTDGPFPAAREWGRREQGMHYDAGHVQAGAAAHPTGQALRTAMPGGPHGQAHFQMQQQQDFSFQMPQVQQRGYTPQQSDLAGVPGFGVSCRARVPRDLAQPAARAQQQPFTAQPCSPQVPGCQQEMSPLPQFPHAHAWQRPTPAMVTGHLPAGGQSGIAVCGDLAPEHPAAMNGTGYSTPRTGADPSIELYGRLLPAQQQLMWQHAPPMQEGQMQASTAWGPTPTGTRMAHPPLAAYPGPLPEQQSWQYQQMRRPGFAPEHNHV